MAKNPLAPLGNNLGEYLKEQRESARLSVRQLSDLAGVSNPYLSQIERGVKRPSAEILQQIAKGLSISAETLYVQAGLLDPAEPGDTAAGSSATRSAIRSDAALTSRQRQTLVDIYDSFVGSPEDPDPATVVHAVDEAVAATSGRPTAARRAVKRTTSRATKTTKSTKASTASTTSRTSTAKASTASRRAKGTAARTPSSRTTAGKSTAAKKTSGGTAAARSTNRGPEKAAGRNRRSTT